MSSVSPLSVGCPPGMKEEPLPSSRPINRSALKAMFGGVKMMQVDLGDGVGSGYLIFREGVGVERGRWVVNRVSRNGEGRFEHLVGQDEGEVELWLRSRGVRWWWCGPGGEEEGG